MWSALAGASIPVALGVAIALMPWFRHALLRPARAVAVAAVLAVVCLELLPSAWASEGWLAVGVFLGALGAPVVLERIVTRYDLAVELAFGLLLLHQVVDGFEVGTAHRTGVSAWPVTAAIAAHSVPFVAAVVLGLAQRRGPRGAALRGGSLLIATMTGVVVGWSLPAAIAHVSWLPAVVGGILLHVVWHDLAPAHAHDHTH